MNRIYSPHRRARAGLAPAGLARWGLAFVSLALASLALPRQAAAAPALGATRTDRPTLLFDNVPELSADLTAKLDDYLAGRDATPLGWTPTGQLLITTRFGDIDQLHTVEKPLGARRQVTFQHEPVSRGGFSPDPGRHAFFFLKAADGGDRSQLYYQRQGETGARLLTDGKSLNGAAIWSNAGREIAFFSTSRDGLSMDIDVVDPESGALPRLVAGGDGASWYPLDWSPDDRKLLVLKTVSRAESSLYVVELAGGEKREIAPAPAQQKVSIRDARFSRDGQGVYLISDRDGEFAQLRYLGLFNNDNTVMSARIPWDIETLALSRDGHYLAYVSNEAGVGKLAVIDLKSRQESTPRLPAAGLIRSLSFDAESKRLAFSVETSNAPRDAFVLDLAGNTVEPWTQSEPGAVNSASFIVPRVTQFPTFDRPGTRFRDIPAYLYEPAKPGPHPVLIVLRGGPHSQFRPGFDPWIQFVVNELGMAVVAPNLRGSYGYGKSFLALDGGMLREDAVKDLGALLVWLAGQSAFDARRVVVSGEAAYGGYLALAALVNYGDRLRGGVDLGGITDFIRFVGQPFPPIEGDRRAEFGDERDPDARAFLRRLSPLTNVERITRPVLIVHGLENAGVPPADASQLVNQLRRHGIDVEYLQANEEGAVFRRKHDRDAYLAAFAQFLTTLR